MRCTNCKYATANFRAAPCNNCNALNGHRNSYRPSWGYRLEKISLFVKKVIDNIKYWGAKL